MARSKKKSKETPPDPTPKVFGWVSGKPAYLQEHPDNKKENN